MLYIIDFTCGIAFDGLSKASSNRCKATPLGENLRAFAAVMQHWHNECPKREMGENYPIHTAQVQPWICSPSVGGGGLICYIYDRGAQAGVQVTNQKLISSMKTDQQ